MMPKGVEHKRKNRRGEAARCSTPFGIIVNRAAFFFPADRMPRLSGC
jgi:hypothetical protein